MFDALDGFGAIGQSAHDFVIWRDSGVRDIFVLELYRVTESITFGVLDVTFVCAVMLR